MINTQIKIFIFFTISIFLLAFSQNIIVAETINLTVKSQKF